MKTIKHVRVVPLVFKAVCTTTGLQQLWVVYALDSVLDCNFVGLPCSIKEEFIPTLTELGAILTNQDTVF